MKNSILKLKRLLENQLKTAVGQQKIDIERKLAEIEHSKYRNLSQDKREHNFNMVVGTIEWSIWFEDDLWG